MFEWTQTRSMLLGQLTFFNAGALCFMNKFKGMDPILAGMFFSEAVRLAGLIRETINCTGMLEAHLVPIQKCFKLLDIPQERMDQKVKEGVWPTEGKIEFKNVDLRYRPKTEKVLKELSYTVRGGEKIGVVGRTGAGKSTTGLALARIIEIAGGQILIDGVDISQISLK